MKKSLTSLIVLLATASASVFAVAAMPAPRTPVATTAAPRATPAPAPRAATAPASRAEAAPPARRLSPAELAANSPVPIWRRNGILVEQGGRALYFFTQDSPGRSNCDQRCVSLWPPHYAEAGAKAFGPFTLATSFDGRPMWAFEGKPLYRWVSDRKRGAAGGDGVAGAWFLVKVPANLEAQVTPYYPMPMPRPGQRRPAPPAAPAATLLPRTQP